MCGITGIFGLANVGESEGIIQRMNGALAHRGPNAEGTFIRENIALGHRRLSIIDLNQEADQPMTDASRRYTLIFNGEIYNFRELRRMLPEYPFKTKGDTEVLLAGLAKWGVSFLKECHGMFAFAFWDRKTEELILARDRFGIKPLYYFRKGNQLYFSSEIRSLLKSGEFNAQLNRQSLPTYLQYQTVYGTQTILEGMYSLPPGSFMKVTDEEFSIEYFWKTAEAYRPEVAGMNYSDIKENIRDLLDASIERRLVADVPLGAFLSGGIDSSALVGLASENSSRKVKTFTITFADEEFSEARFARQIAEKFKTDHTEIRLDPEEMLRQLPDALSAMDHPSGDGINTFVVAGAAKKAGITVALSGIGGDELFAGYPIFTQYASISEKQWLLSFPKFMRDIGGAFYEKLRPGVASAKIRQVLNEDYFDIENIYRYSREVSSRRVSQSLLSYPLREYDPVYTLVKEGVGYGSPGYRLPGLSRVSYAEMATYLESTLLRDADQMSMAHALEVRVPFLDHALVSFVLSVPDEFKYPHSPKKLLVESLGDLLPENIVNRPKMGFTFPWETWMKGELKEFCSDMIFDLGKRPEFRSAALEKRWKGFLSHAPGISWSRIWHLCILEAWLGKNGI